ncbi:GNAT family N-acetyltransferase [Facklamia sp. DSM 111019]|nr:GNAT family N-acetyltransferase [Facklamia lactis]
MFESSKINLRKLTSEDVEIYHNWRNDIEVMKFTSPIIDTYSYHETEVFVKNVLLSSPNSKAYIIETIERKAIGIISLINIDFKNQNAEIIIDIGDKESWGKGYGTEAITMLVNYAFNEMNLHKLYLKVFSFNKAAIRLYQKIGFENEGVSKEMLYREGEWHDVFHMGLCGSDWLKKE